MKTNPANENNICWCGHTLDAHVIDYEFCCDEHSEVDYPICLDCREADPEDYGADHYFKQDNLAFLERLNALRQKDI